MKITFWKGVFCADHRPGDEVLLKKCGFEEHEPTLCDPSKCRACSARIGRRYWSPRIEDATKLRAYCNDRALEVMRKHLSRLAESRAVDSNIVVPSPPGLSYLPYQRAGIAYASSRKDTLIGDEMGLGKTIQALGFINYAKPKKVLIIAPATLVLNWDIEVRKWLVLPYRIVLPQKGSDSLAEFSPDDNVLVLVNYEKIHGHSKSFAFQGPPIEPNRKNEIILPTPITNLLPHTVKLDDQSLPHFEITAAFALSNDSSDRVPIPISHDKKKIILKPPPDFPAKNFSIVIANTSLTTRQCSGLSISPVVDTPLSKSLKRPWDLLIVDEAHALKNPESLRSISVLGHKMLYDLSRRSLFLSGTPIENRPVEIWPIAAALCPAKFGDWWTFTRRYCALHQETRCNRTIWVADGSSHHSELQQRLRTSFMIRRLKRDVLKELPPKRRQMIVLRNVTIDWQQCPELKRWKELHGQEFESALAHLEASRTMDEYKRAARHLDTITIPFTKTSKFRHEAALAKLPACLLLIDEMLDAGLDSLVIFAHHKDVIQKLSEHYGDNSCVIYGDTSMEDRMPIVQAFQRGEKKIFIGGLKAAGVGLNLTRASNLVMVESDWNPAVVVQAEDRLCRYGQKMMVNVIHPVLSGTLDANMVKMVLAKQRVVDKILDSPTELKLRAANS